MMPVLPARKMDGGSAEVSTSAGWFNASTAPDCGAPNTAGSAASRSRIASWPGGRGELTSERGSRSAGTSFSRSGFFSFIAASENRDETAARVAERLLGREAWLEAKKKSPAQAMVEVDQLATGSF
jgi:hypothetical protein